MPRLKVSLATGAFVKAVTTRAIEMAGMVRALVDFTCSWQITYSIGNHTVGISTIMMIGRMGESDASFPGCGELTDNWAHVMVKFR